MADRSNDVEAKPWPSFQRWWRNHWQPGQHVALVGPTGSGKSTLACHLLRVRWYVLALDPKGGDGTLAASGLFERVVAWPPGRDVRKRIEDAEGPVRLVVGPVVTNRSARDQLIAAQQDALVAAIDEGGWTIYVDELQVAADRRLMGLGPLIEEILISARSKGISLVTSYQAPRWVPPSASQQATWVFMWRTMDRTVVDRMSEVLGRDRMVIRQAVQKLGDHDVLVGGRKLSDPLFVTSYPPVAPKAPEDDT